MLEEGDVVDYAGGPSDYSCRCENDVAISIRQDPEVDHYRSRDQSCNQDDVEEKLAGITMRVYCLVHERYSFWKCFFIEELFERQYKLKTNHDYSEEL